MTFPPTQTDAGRTDPQSVQDGVAALVAALDPNAEPDGFTDAQLLSMWERWKRECFDQRWIFERQWMRNVWYILNRQWIYFDVKRGQWQDIRLAKWIPRPVTNYLKDAVQAVRANLAAINYGANARPLGDDPVNVITAGVADQYAPVLHEDHDMDAIMNEFDFWALVTGNAALHTYVERDIKNGVINVDIEKCASCNEEYPSNEIADAKQKCPGCDSPGPFSKVGSRQEPIPKGAATALSPFEYAFPLIYESFKKTPIVVRLRWRDKTYYEQTPGLEEYARSLSFSKSPQERTMQIFKTLPYQNDMGTAASLFTSGGANTENEGIVEYDIWIKPCNDFPKGQVIRIAGDKSPVVIHLKSEALPGPLPYTDAKGTPLWPWEHARYESVGGRALGSSLVDPGIAIQNTINQIDSHALMIIGRMANPVWLEPKGAEVEKFTGEPGLVVKWNPLVAGGNAKPERIPGEGINQTIMGFREMKKAELEEILGTNDLLKGQKPAGVEAFAALNLLVERGQAKHASYYKERGNAYKGWFKIALELEREFGEPTRTKAIMSPTKEWAFETFKKADLGGSVDIIIEDGTLTPKTSLCERAAIEHLRQLGLLNPQDSDQVMAIYEKFGQSRLLPGLDAQVKEAWMVMDRFEKLLSGDPKVLGPFQQKLAAAQGQAQQMAATGQAAAIPPPPQPLVYKRWYNPQIHRQELVKWCLSDRGRNTFAKFPQAEMFVDQYLAQIDMALMAAQMGQIDSDGKSLPMMPGAPGGPGGPGSMSPDGGGNNGGPMAASNRNAAGAGPQSSGSAGTSQANSQGNQPQQ